jgi:hypothetical protein
MMPNPKADATEGVLIFATTLADAKKAAQAYVKRWKIECMFRHMKTNGYNLEDLNLKDSGKNLLLMALLATAYILAVMEGYKRRNQIPIQQYADETETLETSYFRCGLAYLTTQCFGLIKFINYIIRILKPQKHHLCKNVQ